MPVQDDEVTVAGRPRRCPDGDPGGDAGPVITLRAASTPDRGRRLVVVWLSTALALVLADALLPGLDIDRWPWALAAAALLGLLNTLVWPVLVRLALPLSVLTLGLLPLALNAGMVLLVGSVLPGVHARGLLTGLVTMLLVSIVISATVGLLSLDDEDVWTQGVVRRAVRRGVRRGAAAGTGEPGFVFVQLDGLGHDVLQRAIRDGNAPTLASWLRAGSHRLTRWETDWSSQTGASQAGILLGSNEDIPAFRWLEKETGQVMVSNRRGCAAEIERRRSTGQGLLHDDGISRGNLFTGDAPGSVLTMSVAGRRQGRVGSGYYAYFAGPYNAIRTLTGTVAEVARELVQAHAQRRHDVLPRVRRGGVYPLLRAFTTVISRDVLTTTVIGDMAEGRGAVYANYVGYDEVAHHSGTERHEALQTLRRLDRELGRLARAAAQMPRPYRLVVLSDHGQSQGATFRQRYGETLADVVARATGARTPARPDAAGEESWGYAAAALDEVAHTDGAVGSGLRRLTRDRRLDDDVVLGPDRATQSADGSLSVLASGNLGLISVREVPGRVTKERLDADHPDLLPSLAGHPGIGFLLVATEHDGPLVIGPHGHLLLDTGDVVGEDPLLAFGPRARRQVGRTHGFAHCADIMVNSLWDQQTDEVAAFEELVGSHGGLGGAQSHPFVLHPADLPLPEEVPVFGAEALHHLLVSWRRHGAAPEPPADDLEVSR